MPPRSADHLTPTTDRVRGRCPAGSGRAGRRDLVASGPARGAVSARTIAMFDATAPVPGFRSCGATSCAPRRRDIDATRPELVAVRRARCPRIPRDIVIAVLHDSSSAASREHDGRGGCDDACYVTADTTTPRSAMSKGRRTPNLRAAGQRVHVSARRPRPRLHTPRRVSRSTKFLGHSLDGRHALASKARERRDTGSRRTSRTRPRERPRGDGTSEMIRLGSIQNAAQTERDAASAVRVNTTARAPRVDRTTAVPRYTSGPGRHENIVGITNPAAIAEIDRRTRPRDRVAGFDQRSRR